MTDQHSRWRRLIHSRLFFPLVCLALVLALNVVITMVTTGSPGPFFDINFSNGTINGPLITILNRSSELVILAVGMTIVIASSGGVDISVGAVMALSGAVSVWLLGYGTLADNSYHVASYVVPYGVGLLAAIAVGAICGAWNGLLVAKLRIQAMVATLILFTGGRGLAKVVSEGQITKVDVPSYKFIGNFIQDGSGHNVVPVSTAIFVAAAVVALAGLLLRHSALGMNIQAVGINPKSSRLVGLNSGRVVFFAFVFCGVCAALAGIIATSRIGAVDSSNVGKLLEMDAILAVALGGNSLAGGRFSLAGSVIGAITIQSLTTVLYSVNVSADQLPFYKAIVVVLIVVLQSPELRPMLQRLRRRFRPTAGLRQVVAP
ncbi:MAG: ABC transporter permease [Propionibacteriaceae bacterium]|jgi:simple sugar transport system permease protein|nr:ABC transporter permease [Propionibacteriaceae bacterium]